MRADIRTKMVINDSASHIPRLRKRAYSKKIDKTNKTPGTTNDDMSILALPQMLSNVVDSYNHHTGFDSSNDFGGGDFGGGGAGGDY